MKYVVKMGSVSMLHIPSFIKTYSGIQKLLGGWGGFADTQNGDLISLYLFFQNTGSRLVWP
jgi:hypothetical protein